MSKPLKLCTIYKFIGSSISNYYICTIFEYINTHLLNISEKILYVVK